MHRAWFGGLMASLLCLQASAEELPITEEVVVWGEHHVRQARAVVIREMESEGWEALKKRRGDRVVFRPPEAWMGKAFLTVDGRLEFGRPILAAEPRLVPGTTAEYQPDQVLDRMDGNGISAGAGLVILPSERKLSGVHQQLQAQLEPSLDAYIEVFRETQFRTLVQELPDRLDAVWRHGRAMRGDPSLLESPAQRREDVLAFWAQQGSDEDGLVISALVETWIKETVQRSDSPLTPSEIAKAEGQRLDGRKLLVEGL